MWKDFFILVLFITTIIFLVLFLIYYNRVGEFMKDKEVFLNNKEADLVEREARVEEIEECQNNLVKCNNKLDGVKELVK